MKMKRNDFLALLKTKILVMDGAYGTEIMSKAKNLNFSEEANILYPDLVYSLHKNYIEAGADIIKTNTFGLFHLLGSNKIDENYAFNLLKAGIETGIKARKNNVFCFASFGPVSDSVFEYKPQTIERFEYIYRKAAEIALNSGIDGILFETFSDFLELKTAVNSVRDLSDEIPVIAQFTLNSNGATIQGAEAENCGAFLETIDCDVAGINCSTGPLAMAKNFPYFAEYISKPMSASPNAGLPEFKDGRVYYPDMREDFKKAVKIFVENGARIVGSCCGSSPDYTNAVKETVLASDFPYREKEKKDFLVSNNYIFDFEKENFLPIGERLNLLGNKTFKANYLEDKKIAYEIELNRQLSAGAKCVDFNIDLFAKDNPGLGYEDMLLLQNIAKPLISIDTLYPEVMEKCARYSACSPVLNSSDLTVERFKKVAEIYKKYGGKIIVLLMSGKKIPKTLEERIKGLEILDMLSEKFSISAKDIFVDPLALTLGTGVDNFSYVESIVEKSRYKTVVGLSNFSHGLPDRSRLNAFLLTHLLRKGLNASILDVSDPNIAGVIYNHNAVFRGKGFASSEKGGLDFAGDFGEWGFLLLKGKEEDLSRKVYERLKIGDKPSFILEKGLIANMEKIGEYFEQGKVYLPQLLVAADTMKKAFEIIKPFLEEEVKASGETGKNDGRIILFTVQNDVHDIGKNIVLTVLKSFGFSVFDGGIDKKPEEIIEEVKSTDAKIVGLSALMTTSLPYMKKTVKELKEKLPEIKVIVGGAVVTKRFAEEIGADGYGKNAFDAVNLVREML